MSPFTSHSPISKATAPHQCARNRIVACALLTAGIALSGCGFRNGTLREPRQLAAMSPAAVPIASVTPVEPPPPAPASSLPKIEPPPAVAIVEPPPTPSFEQPLAEARAEIERLRTEFAALQKQQLQSQSAMESLTASSLAAAHRAAAHEAQIALQSSLIDDLRNGLTLQRQEQWKAMDAVSDAIDKLIKTPAADPVRPVPPTRDESLGQEILSRRPSSEGVTK